MYGLLTPDYGSPQTGGKKYKANNEKGLKPLTSYGIVVNRDILLDLFRKVIKYPCSRKKPGAGDHKEVQKHEQV